MLFVPALSNLDHQHFLSVGLVKLIATALASHTIVSRIAALYGQADEVGSRPTGKPMHLDGSTRRPKSCSTTGSAGRAGGIDDGPLDGAQNAARADCLALGEVCCPVFVSSYSET